MSGCNYGCCVGENDDYPAESRGRKKDNMPPVNETPPNALDATGTAYHDPTLELSQPFSSQDERDRWALLTAREREIAILIGQGNNGHEVAKALGISVKTYDTHRGHLLKKLNLRDAVALVKFLIRTSMVHA